MGLLNALRLTRSAAPSSALVPEIGSPWATSDLSVIAWADLIPADFLPMTRAEALSVPAMARARDLLCVTAAAYPLRALRGAVELSDLEQPSWMYRTDGPVSPWHRMLWTVDDLLFTGWSLWVVERGADGFVLAADRVPRDRWEFDTSGRAILVDGHTVAGDAVIAIPGPHEGVLNRSCRALRAAALLERSVATRAANPVPIVDLHQTTDIELTEDEKLKLINGFGTAVQGANGGSTGIAFTSYGIEARILGAASRDGMLLESRNAAAVDVARMTGVPASLLDATNAGASLTYETTTGRGQEFRAYAVSAYSGAIEARLSLDDVVPRGVRSAFDVGQDLTTTTPAPVAPTGVPGAPDSTPGAPPPALPAAPAPTGAPTLD